MPSNFSLTERSFDHKTTKKRMVKLSKTNAKFFEKLQKSKPAIQQEPTEWDLIDKSLLLDFPDNTKKDEVIK